MHKIINNYLQSLGLNGLYVDEYNAVMELIGRTCKVDAIKKLRDFSANTSSGRLQLACNNAFSAYVEAHGLEVFEESKRLGLKEAKEVVDFIILNWDQIKRMPAQ